MVLNTLGEIIADEWQKSSKIRQEITLDAWVIMLNHFHGIVKIANPNVELSNSNIIVGANGGSPCPCPTIHNSPSTIDIDNARSHSTNIDNSDTARANRRSPLQGISMKPRSLSTLISGLKSATTKQINIVRNAPGTPIWQRNYYEHIIRDVVALQYIREYISKNPATWDVDQLHPDNPSKW